MDIDVKMYLQSKIILLVTLLGEVEYHKYVEEKAFCPNPKFQLFDVSKPSQGDFGTDVISLCIQQNHD
jgi:hypothetical protein